MNFKIVKIIIALLIMFSVIQNSYSQDEENKWVIGLGMNAVDFFPSNGIGQITGNFNGFGNELFNVEDHWNRSAPPKINITRHIWKNLSLDLAYTRNKIYRIGDFWADDLPYSAIDLSVQYNILKNSDKFKPYVLVGTGYTSIDEKSSGTFNTGLGIKYWFSEQFGVNADAAYKYAELDFPMIQHFQYSISVVHRFGSGRRGGNRDCIVTK